jgi:integrase
LAVCSKMFSLSLSSKAGESLPWRNAVQGNPCKGVARNHEEQRDRFFSKGELEKIADALAEYPGVGADCIRLIMLTGCRPGEALQAQWPEFDKESGSWVKPSAHTKQRKLHKVPLSPPALELIERLRKKRKGDGWVFPGDILGEHLAAVHHVWSFVRKHAQLEKDEQGREARPYDLRHTFGTVGVGGGLNLPLIGRLLGHTQARTTQRYAHMRLPHRRRQAAFPGPIQLTEAAIAVAVRMHGAVLLPEQLQRHALPPEFAMDRWPRRLWPPRLDLGQRRRRREQPHLQRLVA